MIGWNKHTAILTILSIFLVLYCGGNKKFAELEKNISEFQNPQFKVGDIFEYEIDYKFNPLYYRTSARKRIMSNVVTREVFNVSEVSTYNGIEIYLINVNCYNKIGEKILSYRLYIDKNNGEVVKSTFEEDSKLMGFNSKFTQILGFYEPWMLKLLPGKSFDVKDTKKVSSVNKGDGFRVAGIKSFEQIDTKISVKKIEEFEGVNCFLARVEVHLPIERVGKDTKYEIYNHLYHIDIHNRVIVRHVIEGDVTREKKLVIR